MRHRVDRGEREVPRRPEQEVDGGAERRRAADATELSDLVLKRLGAGSDAGAALQATATGRDALHGRGFVWRAEGTDVDAVCPGGAATGDDRTRWDGETEGVEPGGRRVRCSRVDEHTADHLANVTGGQQRGET
jgi:hypothetical protein